MNMSAKVVKREAAEKLASLKIFDLGVQGSPKKEWRSFIFPDASVFMKQAERETPKETLAKVFEETAETTAVEETERLRMIEEILREARAEADAIIKKAEGYQADVEQAAREKGLQEARLMFEQEVAERVNAEVAPARETLAQTIARVSALEAEIAAKIETELLEFALEIAKKIVGREVTIDREVALTLVKLSLAKLHNRTFAKIYLNPQDLAFVEAHRERLNFHGSLELTEDNSVSPGGCLVHTETGDIDARIESQFDEIAHGLLGKG